MRISRRRALVGLSLLLALAAIPSGWVALQHYQQFAFVQKVEATGGNCTLEATGAFWLPKEVTIAVIEEEADPEVTDRAIASAADQTSLSVVLVHVHSPMTEKRLALLEALAELPLSALILQGECGSELQIARLRVALREHVELRTTLYKGVVFDEQKFADEVKRLRNERLNRPSR
jgi:hypothetical protein